MNSALREKIYTFFEREFADLLQGKIDSGYNLADFNIHPFNLVALASGVFGEANSKNMAKALIYPRALGTSIVTSFGNKMQKLCVSLLEAEPSGVPGMDFHFTDKVDGGKVFMQLKAGPNNINSGDVEPILEEMRSAYRLLKTNMAGKKMPKFAMGIVYGTIEQISGSYKAIQNSSVGAQDNVPIFIGKDLWHRITGDTDFYFSLIDIFIELFEGENYSKSLDRAINNLAKEIQDKYFVQGKFNPRA
ncbi:MAG: PmeII family type II restriction endonuclease [Patescibacteria group bacterium]